MALSPPVRLRAGWRTAALFRARDAARAAGLDQTVPALIEARRGRPPCPRVVKRQFRIVIGAGRVVLIAMGVLIWSGELFQLNIQAQQALNGLDIDCFNSI